MQAFDLQRVIGASYVRKKADKRGIVAIEVETIQEVRACVLSMLK